MNELAAQFRKDFVAFSFPLLRLSSQAVGEMCTQCGVVQHCPVCGMKMSMTLGNLVPSYSQFIPVVLLKIGDMAS